MHVNLSLSKMVIRLQLQWDSLLSSVSMSLHISPPFLFSFRLQTSRTNAILRVLKDFLGSRFLLFPYNYNRTYLHCCKDWRACKPSEYVEVLLHVLMRRSEVHRSKKLKMSFGWLTLSGPGRRVFTVPGPLFYNLRSIHSEESDYPGTAKQNLIVNFHLL